MSQTVLARKQRHRKFIVWPRIHRKKKNIVFSGDFSKLRKAAISFVMSVRPSARMEQLGYHGTEFHEILYLII